MKPQTLFILITFLIFSTCKNKVEEKDESFTFIERGDYVIDSYGDVIIHRTSKTNEVMDGYYVIGNELSKWEEFNLENGILNGEYIVFHPNGEIYTQSTYVNGKLEGEEKTFSVSGKLQSLKTYKNNELYGKTKSYFETGQLRSESIIENGKTVESTSYDIVGTIVSQMYIEDGHTISQQIIGGKVHSEQISSNYDNFEAIKFYNEDGSLKIYLRMLTEGDNGYLIELDKDGHEIKRIDVKANPQEVLKYQKYFSGF